MAIWQMAELNRIKAFFKIWHTVFNRWEMHSEFTYFLCR